MVRLNNGDGWCGSSLEPGANWVLIDLKAPTIIRGFRTMSVTRQDGSVAFTSAVRIQYTDDLTDVFKDYRNPDGTAVEFRILEPTLSILNLPVPIEAQYIKFKIQDYVGSPCLKLEVMGCTRLECADINECAVNNGGCDQKCVNSPGDFFCNCNVGFELYTQNGTSGYPIELSENGLRDGDILQINKSCVPVMCPNLLPPENGVLLSTKVLQLLFFFTKILYYFCICVHFCRKNITLVTWHVFNAILVTLCQVLLLYSARQLVYGTEVSLNANVI